MKKLTKITLIGVTTLTLAACSNNTETKVENKIENKVERISSIPKKEVQVDKDVYFKDGVLNTKNITVKILNYQILKSGDPGTEYSKGKSLIVFTYEVTNKSDEDVTADLGWLEAFEVIQDNDPNTINTLDPTLLSNDENIATSYDKIKKGGTVKNTSAFILTDDTTPVTIVGHDGLSGIKLGEQKFEIK